MLVFLKDLSKKSQSGFFTEAYLVLTVQSGEKVFTEKSGPNLAIAINKGLFTISKKRRQS